MSSFTKTMILLTIIYWNLVHRLVGFKLRCAKIFKQCDSCIIKDHTADANQSHWMVGRAKIAMSYIVLASSHFALRVWWDFFFFFFSFVLLFFLWQYKKMIYVVDPTLINLLKMHNQTKKIYDVIFITNII